MTSQHSAELMAILGRNETLLMDGALGTELERRQLPIEGAGWSALAVRDHGEVIRDIHQEYLKAGARLHIVNSFALARHVLEPIGMGNDFAALNRRAVLLFDEAVVRAGANRSQPDKDVPDHKQKQVSSELPRQFLLEVGTLDRLRFEVVSAIAPLCWLGIQ